MQLMHCTDIKFKLHLLYLQNALCLCMFTANE